jgi:D-sedoheptulose 7-phosphate isomerase
MYDFCHYVVELTRVLEHLPLEPLERICEVLYKAYEDDRVVFVFGNGGSAALASHIACDLGKGTHSPCPSNVDMSGVKRLKVFSVTDNVPMLTAWANDAAYEDVFAEQIENFVQPGDVAFAISGSGNSPNVLKALRVAREKGATTVGLTGSLGGKMKELLDLAIIVPSDSMQHIEDAHLVLSHMIFLNVRARIVSLGACLRDAPTSS